MWTSTRCRNMKATFFNENKTLILNGKVKNILFKVLAIAFYTFWPPFRQFVDSIPKELLLFWRKPVRDPISQFFGRTEVLLLKGVSHRWKQMLVGRRQVWWIMRLIENFPFYFFEVVFIRLSNKRSGFLMLKKHVFMSFCIFRSVSLNALIFLITKVQWACREFNSLQFAEKTKESERAIFDIEGATWFP